MPRPQGVNVTGKIVPTDTADTFPVIDPVWGIDGLRSLANHATRNAIPAGLRREGMLVYTRDDQLYWQLGPEPWTGNDADWGLAPISVFPYSQPAFLTFDIEDQAATVIVGASISGTITFEWSTLNASSLQTNSVTITDATTSTVIASGLPTSGTHNYTLPSPITNANPTTHTWTITALDVKTQTVSGSFTVTWIAVSNNTYYVNNQTGNDSNTGLSGHPWLTLQKAADSVAAGDLVHVQVGNNHYTGMTFGLNVAVSGTADAPIVFLADSGVIIDHWDGHRHRACIELTDNCSFITIDGFILDTDGSLTPTLTTSGYRAAGNGTETGNVIQNCTVRNIPGVAGIFTGFQNNFSAINNVITNIQAAGGSLITGHAIYWSNSATGATITGNRISNIQRTGFHSNGDLSSGGVGVQSGALIDKNIFIGGNLGAPIGGCINCDGLQNSTITNNLIYGEHGGGIVLYSQDSSGPSSGNLVANNTVVLASDAGRPALYLTNGAINNTVVNNIFFGTDHSVNGSSAGNAVINYDSLSGLTLDYNCYLEGVTFGLQDSIGNNGYLTFAQWQFAGHEPHSIASTADAVFSNVSVSDYHLKSGSTVVGIGTSTGAPSLDLDGQPRPYTGGSVYDLGCYVYDPSKPIVIATDPVNHTTNVVTVLPAATYSHAVTGGSITFTLADSLGNTVAGSASYNSGTHVVTFTPSGTINPLTRYIATVSGATDGGGHTQAAPYSWDFTTTPAPSAGPFSIFPAAAIPAALDSGDPLPIEAGLRFHADQPLKLTGFRFYKAPLNTGTHKGNLYNVSGSLLATVTYSGESGSGWQSQTLASPFQLVAGTTYIVSFTTSTGHYATDPQFFTAAYVNGLLTAPADSVPGPHNGLYLYYGGFPTASFNSVNYWCDILADGRSPLPSATSVFPRAATVSAYFNVAVQSGTITFTLKDHTGSSVSGSHGYDGPTQKTTFTPTANLLWGETYTATIDDAVILGGTVAMPAANVWTFTTAAQPGSVAVSSTSPADNAGGVDTAATVTFTFNQDVNSGTITFALTNGGTVAGSVSYDAPSWTATFTPSTLLATDTVFTGTVSAATAATGGGTMASPHVWTFTTQALETMFGTITPGIPAESDSSAYTFGTRFVPLVDGSVYGVRFHKSTTNTPSGTRHGYLWSITDNTTGTLLGTCDFNSETSSGWQEAAFTSPIAITANTLYAVGYDCPNGHYSVDTPTTGSFDITCNNSGNLIGLQSASTFGGNVINNGVYATAIGTFPSNQPSHPISYYVDPTFLATGTLVTESIWGTPTPSTADSGDGSALTYGLRFQASADGHVLGVRFYKHASNVASGTHRHQCYLWSNTGTILAAVELAPGSEPTSGWVDAYFLTPVAITAGVTYVVGYFLPSGHGSLDTSYFSSAPHSNGSHLTALQDNPSGDRNGVYNTNTTGGTFPATSGSGSNFWVDVIYQTP